MFWRIMSFKLLSKQYPSYKFKRCLSYKQGQYVNEIRQYFYYIDHEGQLFMDDARMKNFTSCFKGWFILARYFYLFNLDVRFLNFFFARLRINSTGKYEREFPYIGLCQGEENFLRCDDRPIVYTKLDADQNCFYVGNCSRKVDFHVSSWICIIPKN